MKTVFIRCATESLGIEYLAAALKARGHETALVYEPLLFNSFRVDIGGWEKGSAERAAKKALALNPGLVALSAESDYYGWALLAAAEIKKRSKVPVIFGGVHPTLMPEEVLGRTMADFVCVGEGELALPALCDALENGRGIDGIPNIWGRGPGGLIKNSLETIPDLDALPFPDKDLFAAEYAGFVTDTYSIVTGRGCRNACTYCHNSSMRRAYAERGERAPAERRRSPANVIAELALAKARYGFKRVSFCDDLFISDKAWLREFSRLYAAAVSLPFFCNIHPAHVDTEAVSLLAGAGCSAVTIGIQTVSDELKKKRLARGESTDTVRKALRLLEGSGIFVYTNFIFGIPGQDEDELKAIARFAAGNPAGFHDVNWLRYYPKAKITDYALEDSLLDGAQAAEIDRGEKKLLYAHGGHSYTPARARLRNLVLLSALLGGPITRALLRSGAYRLLPAFSLRTPAVILITLAAKFTGRAKNPYPNFSLLGSARYFLNYLRRTYLPAAAEGAARAAGLALKLPVNAITRRFFLAGLLTPRAAARYASYLVRTGLLRRRIPGTAMIALTFDCQCSCACCSSALFRQNYGTARMDFDAAAARLREIIALGVPRVHFTGGEASLMPRLPELVALCARAGVTVFVETNGLNMDEKTIRAFKAAGLASLNISLDSAAAAEHDGMRGQPGCHAAALNAMKLCSGIGQKCMASAYATPKTLADGRLERLIVSARNAGAGAVRVLPPVASGGWFDNFSATELGAGAGSDIERLIPLFYPVLNRTGLINCALPRAYKIFILPDGALAPCEHLPYVLAGSRDMSVKTALDRMKDLPLFRERFKCWPRDPEFRKKYFSGGVPRKPVEV